MLSFLQQRPVEDGVHVKAWMRGLKRPSIRTPQAEETGDGQMAQKAGLSLKKSSGSGIVGGQEGRADSGFIETFGDFPADVAQGG